MNHHHSLNISQTSMSQRIPVALGFAFLVFTLGTGQVVAQNSSLLRAPGRGPTHQTPSRTVRRFPPGTPNTPTVGFPGSRSAIAPAQYQAPIGSDAQPQAFGDTGAVPLPAPVEPYTQPAPIDNRPPIMLDQVNWGLQPPLPQRRPYQIHDVVTIRVDEITRVAAEGSADSRRSTSFEAILTDWIRLTNFRLRPDPQGNGDPTVAAESEADFRADASVESRESLAFNIAATVVDIRPNGLLVLEATKAIRVNDNLWETSLTGICRAEDIGPDNVLLSKDLVQPVINKTDRGHLRDGYKRGWLQRFIDRFQPF